MAIEAAPLGAAMNTIDRELRSPEPSGAQVVAKIASDRLMQGRREIVIKHGGQEYRLRVTAAGKLILTK